MIVTVAAAQEHIHTRDILGVAFVPLTGGEA
jgi:hypothetical protein